MIDIKKKYTSDGEPVELLTTSGRGAWSVVGYRGDSSSICLWTKKTGQSSVDPRLDLVEVRRAEHIIFEGLLGRVVGPESMKFYADDIAAALRDAGLLREKADG